MMVLQMMVLQMMVMRVECFAGGQHLALLKVRYAAATAISEIFTYPQYLGFQAT